MQMYHYPQPGSMMPSYPQGWTAPLPYNDAPGPQPLPLDQYGSGAFTDPAHHDVQSSQTAEPVYSGTSASSTSPPHQLRSDATSADFMFAGYTNDLVSPTGGMFRGTAAGDLGAARENRSTQRSGPDGGSGEHMGFDGFGVDMAMGPLDFGEPFLDDFASALAQSMEAPSW